MKYLLPLLCCVAVFFGGRQFRIMRSSAAASSPAPQEVTAAVATKERENLRGLARQTQRLASQQCHSAAALEHLYRSGKLNSDQLRQAIAQAAEKDPAGTWEWLQDQGWHWGELLEPRRIVFDAWFKQDPAAAVARLDTLPSFEAGQLVAGVLGKVASDNPAEAAAARAHLDQLMDLLGSQLSQISFPAIDAQGAARLLALPEGLSRDRLLGSFVASWMAKDPAAAATFLKGQPAELRQRSMEALSKVAFLTGGGAELPKEARQLATEWLLKEAPLTLRMQFGPRLADEMAKDDPAKALKWAAENLSGKSLDDATGSIIGRIFTANPADARALVESLPEGKRRTSAASKVVQQWVAKEPEAAITWWLEHSGGGATRDYDSQSAASTIAGIWMNKNPDSFRAWFANPDSPQLPVQFLYTNMRTLLKDRDAGLDWIGSLPPANRTAVLRIAFDHLAMEAPADAAATFDSRPDLATGDGARMIATRWYASNPQKAIAWVTNLPWGGPREAALAGLKKTAEAQAQRGGTIPEELKELLR
ncbi:hypothetical protein [Haloferula sp. BvORR071]|uniref:hypothetical protein n=1 Tax=Haloferula sp. BvORR071 TaxID=1396141 RepID=UPI00054DA870|nr:hypothetical protein [Haloferula sp. BvORR071]